MNERTEVTKEKLVADTAAAWEELNAELDRLGEGVMMTRRDAAGWTVTDHVVHMALWARSMVAMLEGRPRHEALGVDRALYETGGDDAVNAVLQQKHSSLTPAEARAMLREVHEQLSGMVAGLSDGELRRPAGAFMGGSQATREGRPAIDLIYGNTAGHYREHLPWIQALVRE